MTKAALAFVVGAGFGAACAALHLPIPAPSALTGVLAILGVYMGALIVGAIR